MKLYLYDKNTLVLYRKQLEDFIHMHRMHQNNADQENKENKEILEAQETIDLINKISDESFSKEDTKLLLEKEINLARILNHDDNFNASKIALLGFCQWNQTAEITREIILSIKLTLLAKGKNNSFAIFFLGYIIMRIKHCSDLEKITQLERRQIELLEEFKEYCENTVNMDDISRKLLLHATQQNCKASLYWLGENYYDMKDLESQFYLGVEYYILGAMNGCLNSMFQLAKRYVCKPSFFEGNCYFAFLLSNEMVANRRGEAEVLEYAKSTLRTNFYYKSVYPPDGNDLIKYLTELSFDNQGSSPDHNAIVKLAFCYQYGIGTTQNVTFASECYQEAIMRGLKVYRELLVCLKFSIQNHILIKIKPAFVEFLKETLSAKDEDILKNRKKLISELQEESSSSWPGASAQDEESKKNNENDNGITANSNQTKNDVVYLNTVRGENTYLLGFLYEQGMSSCVKNIYLARKYYLLANKYKQSDILKTKFKTLKIDLSALLLPKFNEFIKDQLEFLEFNSTRFPIGIINIIGEYGFELKPIEKVEKNVLFLLAYNGFYKGFNNNNNNNKNNNHHNHKMIEDEQPVCSTIDSYANSNIDLNEYQTNKNKDVETENEENEEIEKEIEKNVSGDNLSISLSSFI